MKKIIIITHLLIASMLFSSSFGINWINVGSPKGSFYLDKDSITKKNGYYFYNIMLNNSYVITMQANLSHSYCSPILQQTKSEYDSKNGDYKNISANFVDSLQPVQFGSIAFSAYKYVKELENEKIKDTIIIGD